MKKTYQHARRIAVTGIAVSGLLAVLKIVVGLQADSTAVVADGFESAADVISGGLVWFGLIIASRPADEDHPYGHGRFEILTGLAIGVLLFATGLSISWQSLQQVGVPSPVPQSYALVALVISIAAKTYMSYAKIHYARRMRSEALLADGKNDMVDILSGTVALVAVTLTLSDPERFAEADHYGGIAVGVIVSFLGTQVVRETALHLMDTMPEDKKLQEIRRVALSVKGVEAVEKCYARKTGMQYHVDLHLQVDPHMTVRDSHEIAGTVKTTLRGRLDWVANVMVHVEPWGSDPN